MSKDKRAKLSKAVAAGHAARRELDKMDADIKDKQNKKLIGTCWRYRNSYGGGESWWLYARITGINDGWLNVLRFEKTSRGNIEITLSDLIGSTDGYQPISEREFKQAWKELMTELESIK